MAKQAEKLTRTREQKSTGPVKWGRRCTCSACLLLFLLFFGLPESFGQVQNYKIIRNGNKIGWMKLEKSCKDNYCKMFLSSEIEFRLLLSFNASVAESAHFLDGKLMYSSQLHTSNGKVDVNKQTMFTGSGYEVVEGKEKQKLAIGNDVTLNLLSLYFREPVSMRKVYCDKQEAYAQIEKTADGGYKVVFPDKNSNTFYYKQGICTRVKIEHSFYTAEILLVP